MWPALRTRRWQCPPTTSTVAYQPLLARPHHLGLGVHPSWCLAFSDAPIRLGVGWWWVVGLLPASYPHTNRTTWGTACGLASYGARSRITRNTAGAPICVVLFFRPLPRCASPRSGAKARAAIRRALVAEADAGFPAGEGRQSNTVWSGGSPRRHVKCGKRQTGLPSGKGAGCGSGTLVAERTTVSESIREQHCRQTEAMDARCGRHTSRSQQ